MSGDSKEQPNLFYTKVPQNEAHDTLLLQGKVKSVYQIADEAEKVYIHFHDIFSVFGMEKRCSFSNILSIFTFNCCFPKFSIFR